MDSMTSNWKAKRTTILVLYAQGKTPTEIAKDVGCSRGTVYNTVARGTPEAPKKSMPKRVRTDDLVEAVSEAIKDAKGKKTVKGLSREFNVKRTTMRRLVKEELGLNSYRRTPRQALKPLHKEKRLERSRILINKLKKKPKDVIILFSDETPFSLGEMVSNESGFYLAKVSGAAEDETKFYKKERHFANLQVIAVVGSDGKKCDLIFLESNERLNAEMYCKYLKEKIFPWAHDTYGDRWWWQQDGASAHTANFTQSFLQEQTPNFFDKNCWPPHSPDLSPLDFAIFGRLKSALSGIHFRTKDELKSAIIQA